MVTRRMLQSQLNEYETAPYFIQLSKNMTSDCLYISVFYLFLPVFAWCDHKIVLQINTQYMRNPDMVYVLKMEYVSKINIFGLKMMVKSGLEKIFLKFLHAQGLFQTSWFTLYKWGFRSKYKFSTKNDLLCAWRDFNRNFFDVCTYNE